MGVQTSNRWFGNEINSDGDKVGQALWGLGPGIFVGGNSTTVDYTPEQVNVDRGAAGFENADAYRRQLGSLAGTAQGRGPAQMSAAQINNEAQYQTRASQADLLGALTAQATGRGDSVAERLMNRAYAQQHANNMSAVRGARGVNPALAMSMGLNQSAAAQANIARDSATARLQEQMQAAQAASGLSGQMRGQDLQGALSQAQLNQQANQANLGADMQQRGMNDAYQQNMLNALLGMEGQIQSGNVTLEQAKIQAEAQERANALQAALANQQNGKQDGGLFGGLGNIFG